MTPDRHDEQLSFRPMVLEDLPQLSAWLQEPHVAEWWDDASETVEGVEAKYRDRVEGEHPVEPWVMEVEGVPVGFVQWYRVEDEAEWYPGLAIPPGTVALDIAIGDPDYVGRGHGRRLVLEFVHHVLRARAPDSPEVWIDPNPRNLRAMRAYRAAGFTDTGIDLPDPDAPSEVRRLLTMSWPGPTFH
ncbi:GNAT family N-acetyltransferase [Aquihabitans sp. McL0605]|uniref:GNAT family N-acetyltransferase n=1 Tax=Aquihabitans sp. McL0605 TaxID=3415671 RepID=UPI003CEFC047